MDLQELSLVPLHLSHQAASCGALALDFLTLSVHSSEGDLQKIGQDLTTRLWLSPAGRSSRGRRRRQESRACRANHALQDVCY